MQMRFLFILALGIMFVMPVTQAKAQNNCCNCPLSTAIESEVQWEQGLTDGPPGGNAGPSWPTVPRLVNHVVSELAAQRVWMTSVLWEDNILPSLMLMTEQLTAVAMKQTMIVGTFFDAKQQMETQQVIQGIRAQAHKDYQPSPGVCEFGSTMKSMAATERKAEYNAFALSQRSQDRQLGNANNSGREGNTSDKESRINQFKRTFCDVQDNNQGLDELCCKTRNDDGECTAVYNTDPEKRNADINYVRTVGFPKTLDVDFTDDDITGTEEDDIFALASNLYGNKLFSRIDAEALKSIEQYTPLSIEAQKTYISAEQKNYLEMRSLLAKRSVAENSFNAIVGMKAKGAVDENGATMAQPYLKGILTEMGLSDSDAEDIIGKNPSYYAQMEILGKKIYQNPDFYTHLYDKPANVERKQVAMQAIGLMQKFDLFKSYLRQEASLSVLLELAVADLQSEIENDIDDLDPNSEKAE